MDNGFGTLGLFCDINIEGTFVVHFHASGVVGVNIGDLAFFDDGWAVNVGAGKCDGVFEVIACCDG